MRVPGKELVANWQAVSAFVLCRFSFGVKMIFNRQDLKSTINSPCE